MSIAYLKSRISNLGSRISHPASHKAQSIAEYAVVIAVISAALLAMQTYVKRGLQGRLRNMAQQISPRQYERSRTESDYTTTRSFTQVEKFDRGDSYVYMGAKSDNDNQGEIGAAETTTRTGYSIVQPEKWKN
ncbi:MAG: hypothetical protein ACE5GG_00345 [Candidatus Omnitrophota bacterium]